VPGVDPLGAVERERLVAVAVVPFTATGPHSNFTSLIVTTPSSSSFWFVCASSW